MKIGYYIALALVLLGAIGLGMGCVITLFEPDVPDSFMMKWMLGSLPIVYAYDDEQRRWVVV